MHKDDVLAVVGSRNITRKDVEVLLQSLNPQTAAQFKSEEGMKSLVGELVNQELIYLDALDNGLDKQEEFLQEVERTKANILKQFALNTLLKDIVVTDSEVVQYYLANKEEFAEPESVKASHILVESFEKAAEVAHKIKNGLFFEEAARKYSTCPSNEQGGDLGYFSRGMMVPEFEEAAFSMEQGQVSAPVKTQFGYHLIKVYDKKENSIKPVDDVRDQIANQLMANKQQELYLHKISELKGKYTVKIN